MPSTQPGISCPNCGYDSTNVLPRLYDAPSPFQHIFDDRASPEQISAARPQLKVFINAVRDELYDAEARVARLREALQAAEQTHAKAEGVLNAHIMLNPPVQSLPPELLSYIFSLTCEKPFHIFKARMPWLLGQVCRHWRAVAWQSPSLLVGRDSLRRDFHGPILEEVLNRSGNIPLEVSLVNPTPGSASILARHASRLSELQMICRFDTLRAFKDAPEMSILTKLCLIASTDGETISDSEPVYFDVASKAPRLTHIILDAALVSVNLPRVILLPWPQITHLELVLGYYNYQYIIDILSQCRNLVSFTDSYREGPRGSGPVTYTLRRQTPHSIYIFPRLTFLAIRSPLAILSYMQCPALQTFALRGLFQHIGFIDTDWVDFRAFMDRSRCTLQEVRLIPEDDLNNSTFFAAPLQKFLAFVSHVPRVEIDFAHSPMGRKGIMNREDNVITFPELQVLTLKANAWVFLPVGVQPLSGLMHQQHVEDELIGAVESRWRVPEGAVRIRMARLELSMMIRGLRYDDFEDPVVKVLYEKLKGTKLLKKMKILKDEGLDVSVVVCVRWSYRDLIVKECTMRCL
ncbi:hypothetical protein BDZ89DRAFT_1070554 [Hymenopellis radicata]|nr:hypothetical protein BDZ89DRAFT_1070554 [Hymenopellis radicata]